MRKYPELNAFISRVVMPFFGGYPEVGSSDQTMLERSAQLRIPVEALTAPVSTHGKVRGLASLHLALAGHSTEGKALEASYEVHGAGDSSHQFWDKGKLAVSIKRNNSTTGTLGRNYPPSQTVPTLWDHLTIDQVRPYLCPGKSSKLAHSRTSTPSLVTWFVK